MGVESLPSQSELLLERLAFGEQAVHVEGRLEFPGVYFQLLSAYFFEALFGLCLLDSHSPPR